MTNGEWRVLWIAMIVVVIGFLSTLGPAGFFWGCSMAAICHGLYNNGKAEGYNKAIDRIEAKPTGEGE